MLAVRMPLSSLASLARFAVRPDTDTELLGRFIADRDEEAFTELVRRHGPGVLAVCRRVTGNRDDADDAFQATFLALARRTSLVRSGSALGGWLYTVAVRAARKALARTCRRRSRESLVAEVPDVPARAGDAPDPDDARAVLEAVAGLSDAYRAAVVLCELEGRSRVDAARELGIPEGTLSSRLAAARRVLADRLRDRGLGAAVLAAVASAAASPDVAAEARRLARSSAIPSRNVELLMETVMKTHRRGWLFTAAAVLVTTALLVAGDRPPKPEPEAAPAPKPVVREDTSRLIFATPKEIVVLTPEGRELAHLSATDVARVTTENAKEPATTRKPSVFPIGRATPDGRLPLQTRNGLQLLTIGPPPIAQPVKVAGTDQILFDGKEMPQIVAWSADGKQAIGVHTDNWLLLPTTYRHRVIDIRSAKEEELVLPFGHRVTDWSPDGTWFLTVRGEQPLARSGRTDLCRVSRDGKTVKELIPAFSPWGTAVIAPDGKRIAFSQWTAEAVATGAPGMVTGFELVVLDLATGAKKVVASEPGGRAPDGVFHAKFNFGICWSPDGTRLACGSWHIQFERRKGHTDKLLHVEWQVGVSGADGSGSRTVFVREGINDWNKWAQDLANTFLDWR
jgi:RNA polymerase sigma factor (sigma-70 family)